VPRTPFPLSPSTPGAPRNPREQPRKTWRSLRLCERHKRSNHKPLSTVAEITWKEFPVVTTWQHRCYVPRVTSDGSRLCNREICEPREKGIKAQIWQEGRLVAGVDSLDVTRADLVQYVVTPRRMNRLDLALCQAPQGDERPALDGPKRTLGGLEDHKMGLARSPRTVRMPPFLIASSGPITESLGITDENSPAWGRNEIGTHAETLRRREQQDGNSRIGWAVTTIGCYQRLSAV
jgi:hypothetical protein